MFAPFSSTSLCKIASRTHITRTQLLRRTEGPRRRMDEENLGGRGNLPSVRPSASARSLNGRGRRSTRVRGSTSRRRRAQHQRIPNGRGREPKRIRAAYSSKFQKYIEVFRGPTIYTFHTVSSAALFAFSLHVGPFVQPTHCLSQ